MNKVILALCIAIAMLVAAINAAADEWKESDSYWLAAAELSLLADYSQTRKIAKDPRYFEHNPILGTHPRIVDVNRYFAAAGILTAGISYVLPKNWREGFLGTVIGVEIITVGNNLGIGLKVGF